VNNETNFNKFLHLSLCPKCQHELVKIQTGFACKFCQENFKYNQKEVILFEPRIEAEKNKDLYEDRNYVEKYAGVFAYGYKVLQFGQMESLHRTVSEMVLSSACYQLPAYILDVGCGVGRATFNCANNLPNTFVVGIDYSEQKLNMAKSIVTSHEMVSLDLTSWGFGKHSIRGFGLNNVFFVQGNAASLPFKYSVFDIVINVNLIDRVLDPEATLKSMVSVLKEGGTFIFTSPLNWNTSNFWNRYPNKETLQILLESYGIEIEELLDGLIYREAIDKRSYSDMNTIVVRGKKVAQS
jgi:ubiquinone/menaquinone biosynthesis C-methylase UbiE